ncbi:MAG: 4-alpha-glucanotransferase [Bacteroidales bacterium]|nr:4-alpha-glucanotransferase [Bacteroidales bacterium]
METLTIKTIGPWMLHGEQILISGNCPLLGGWDPAKALPMKVTQGIIWSIDLDKSRIPESFEYKFIRKSADGTFTWETCFNRTNPYAVTETTFPDQHPRYAGTAVPVFALRSAHSWGIGDFSDIKLMVDWAVATGQAVLQLLPVNDTTSTKTWTDSYPYGGITIMALNPVYLDIRDLGPMRDKKQLAAFEAEARELNALEQIDYERVFDLKDRYAHAIFLQKGARVASGAAYRYFVEKNRDWLMPYAAFCVLRDLYGTADFSKWKRLKKYSAVGVSRLYGEMKSEMDYYIFLQFHLDRQLRDAHEYAHSKGVALKGDIPIGITPHSVEAWAEPEYFNMGEQAGAPPDAFAADGQNWGFPTYNWDRMAQDGYAWWKRRFRKMAEYFDAYRIDHVLGFFRIWEIPVPWKSGLMGHFSPALPYSVDDLRWRGFHFDENRHAKPYCSDDPREVLFLEDPVHKGLWHPRISAQYTRSYADLQQWEKDTYNRLYDEFFYTRNTEFWREQAMRKLPELIGATNMLTCAEDLGMIPACVPQVLSDLHILSLEVQRMPKDPAQDLGRPHEYPYMSVCTTGSHDTSTLRGWWGENHGGEDCPVDTCKWIIAEHLHSPAMLTILPLQDWFSIEPSLRVPDTSVERINIPANPRHYWRYRMHISLEELLANKEFNEKVANMVAEGGRTA